MTRQISIIGAPSSAGAYAPGPDLTPAAFRRHGLVAALAGAGVVVDDRGDTETFRWRPDPAYPSAMNLDAAVRVAGQIADQVAATLADGGRALVLGGDCSTGVGTVAGALRHDGETGVIYIDLDVDLNAPLAGQGDGALSWMGVAHLLGIDGTEPALSGLGPRRPMLQPADLVFFAADSISRNEASVIDAMGLEVIRLDAVKRDPARALAQVTAWAQGFRQVVLHLDVDVLSFIDFPLAEDSRRRPGLTFAELSDCLSALTALPNWRALTITQANPDNAPDEAAAFGRLNALLADCLSQGG